MCKRWRSEARGGHVSPQAPSTRACLSEKCAVASMKIKIKNLLRFLKKNGN